jgi:exodeoxyribonuclease VII large subunit
MEEEILTIFQLTQRIKKVINLSPILRNVYAKGEVSKVVYHSNGNVYVDLKDENSVVNCVIFPRVHRGLGFKIKTGMHVLVKGTVDVYAKNRNSSYQFKINKLERDGIGNLYVEYRKLYEKLEKEGLFDDSKKKAIPEFPNRIGVVTAEKGDAVRDILSKINARWPLCEVLLFPSLVQGENAPSDLIRQIKRSENFDLDVLIVGRGGGSPEDLWCFNDENLARAIFACPIPIITAIGHKPDHSIADDVADLKAFTPTDAGEKVVPDINEIKTKINNMNRRINSKIKSQLELNKGRFNNVLKRPTFTNPYRIHEDKSQDVDVLRMRLRESSKDLIHSNRSYFNILKSSFIFKNPDKLFEAKLSDYNQLVDKLSINSRNFVETKGRKLERLRDSYVLNNPELIIRYNEYDPSQLFKKNN